MSTVVWIVVGIVSWLIGWWLTSFACGYLELYDLNECEIMFVWPCVVIVLLVLWMCIPLETLLSNGHLEKVIGGAFGWLSKGPMFHPFEFGRYAYNKRDKKEQVNNI